MSYVPTHHDDGLEDYLSRLTDFYVCAPHMLNARTEGTFENWFVKCLTIDPRSTLIILRKHKAELPPRYIELAEEYLFPYKI